METTIEMTSERAAKLIARLESKRVEAAADVDRLRRRLSGALIAAEEHGTTAPGTRPCEAERKALALAMENEADAKMALAEAKSQYEGVLRQEAEEREARQWKQLDAVLKKRRSIAKEIEKAVPDLFKLYDKMRRLNVEAYELAPRKETIPFQDCPLSEADFAGYFRLLLFKTGFSWACTWVFGSEAIPQFGAKMIDAQDWLLKLRPAESESERDSSEGEKGEALSNPTLPPSSGATASAV